MPMHLRRRAATAAVAFAVCAAVTGAEGQVYKCRDGSGKTTYSESPCDAASKPLTLPQDVKGSGTDARLCAQLLDETRRLAANADRDAKRGRTESAGNAKRRQALTSQYEARCAGIARSKPEPR